MASGSSDKLNVLQIVPSLISGGVERGTVEIVKALVNENYKAYVCSKGGKLVAEIESAGGVHLTAPMHSKNPIIMILNIYRLIYIILRYKINIVHVRSRAPAWSALFATQVTRAKLVTTFHGTYSIGSSIKRFYNSVMLKGNKVIAVSNFIFEHIKQNYNHVDTGKIQVINRGVDIDYFDAAQVNESKVKNMQAALGIDPVKKKQIILLPSRFVRWKGHLFLLDCLHYLLQKNYICLMVGSAHDQHSDYLKAIREKIQDLQLEDKVFIRGAVSDMLALYSIADIVVVPSIKPEAFGRVVIEAQAMGKIVVAINHGGAASTIIDGENGLHIPLNDVWMASEVLDKALAWSGRKKKEIGAKATRDVRQNYSMDAMCSQTLALYKELVE